MMNDAIKALLEKKKDENSEQKTEQAIEKAITLLGEANRRNTENNRQRCVDTLDHIATQPPKRRYAILMSDYAHQLPFFSTLLQTASADDEEKIAAFFDGLGQEDMEKLLRHRPDKTGSVLDRIMNDREKPNLGMSVLSKIPQQTAYNMLKDDPSILSGLIVWNKERVVPLLEKFSPAQIFNLVKEQDVAQRLSLKKGDAGEVLLTSILSLLPPGRVEEFLELKVEDKDENKVSLLDALIEKHGLETVEKMLSGIKAHKEKGEVIREIREEDGARTLTRSDPDGTSLHLELKDGKQTLTRVNPLGDKVITERGNDTESAPFISERAVSAAGQESMRNWKEKEGTRTEKRRALLESFPLR